MAHLSKIGAWDDIDGLMHITHFDDRDILPGQTEDEFIAQRILKLKQNPKFKDLNCMVISRSEMPSDTSSRLQWSLRNGKIIVDPVKVAQRQAFLVQKQAIFSRIGITEEEFKLLRKK